LADRYQGDPQHREETARRFDAIVLITIFLVHAFLQTLFAAG
jgi:hypothetical protein